MPKKEEYKSEFLAGLQDYLSPFADESQAKSEADEKDVKVMFCLAAEPEKDEFAGFVAGTPDDLIVLLTRTFQESPSVAQICSAALMASFMNR